MKILSHRGYWKKPKERNTKVAFERSFSLGFGTETDIRDHNGKLVISHDMASNDAMLAEKFFDIYCSFSEPLPLALNVKAEGITKHTGHLAMRQVRSDYYTRVLIQLWRANAPRAHLPTNLPELQVTRFSYSSN